MTMTMNSDNREARTLAHLAEYRASTGDRAACRRIESRVLAENASLVRKLVAKATRNRWTSSVEPCDLFQAGCLGLLRAFSEWVPSRGRLATIAWFWIRSAVQNVLRDARWRGHTTQPVEEDHVPDGAALPDRLATVLVLTPRVQAAMAVLTPREVFVIREVYLEDRPRAEIAASLGLGTESVRLIQNEALRKLKLALGE